MGEVSEAGSFGGILADETVGVLIGTSLPGAVGCGEEEGSADSCFDVLVAVELSAVVDGDGADAKSGVVDELDEAESAEPAADLLRTEVLAEPDLDEFPVGGAEVLIASRA